MEIIYNIPKLRERRSELRSNQTKEEIILWKLLHEKKLGQKFRRQHGIGAYIADFYCPKKKLVIEIDGSQHEEKENKEYDEVRTKFFIGLEIEVIRFKNEEINNNLKQVISKIYEKLKEK